MAAIAAALIWISEDGRQQDEVHAIANYVVDYKPPQWGGRAGRMTFPTGDLLAKQRLRAEATLRRDWRAAPPERAHEMHRQPYQERYCIMRSWD